jgi:hypothetical protein
MKTRWPVAEVNRVEREKARLLLSALLLALIVLQPTSAVSQQTVQNPGPNTGEEFFRPPQNLFQLLYGEETAPGSENTAKAGTLNLRLEHRIDLSSQAMLALRSDRPLIAKNPISSSNPEGDYLYGVGDATGRSLGFAPRKILSTYSAARRNSAGMLAP